MLPVLLPLLLLLLLLLLLPPFLCREPLEPDVVELLVAVDAGDRLQIPEHLWVKNKRKQNKKIVQFFLFAGQCIPLSICESSSPPRPFLSMSTSRDLEFMFFFKKSNHVFKLDKLHVESHLLKPTCVLRCLLPCSPCCSDLLLLLLDCPFPNEEVPSSPPPPPPPSKPPLPLITTTMATATKTKRVTTRVRAPETMVQSDEIGFFVK